ncbi:MAG TPA: hypothetical protein VEX68_07710, partial [Bryobacteraceae bacterium]|nr:hypothetical protein [Bryobacteraceae bacterium]
MNEPEGLKVERAQGWAPLGGFRFVGKEKRQRSVGAVGMWKTQLRFPRPWKTLGKPEFGFPRFPGPLISTALWVSRLSHALLRCWRKPEKSLRLASCMDIADWVSP